MWWCSVVLVMSLLLQPGCSLRTSSRPPNIVPDIDCPLRELAWEYAKKLLPQRGQFKEAFDALELKTLCNASLSAGTVYQPRPFSHQVKSGNDAFELFVDSRSGDDSNPGTIARPLKTLHKAVMIFEYKRDGHPGIIYLREGIYFLLSTVELSPEDSNLTITSYKNEQVTISGGRMYHFNWIEYVNEMGPLQNSTNCINDAAVAPGQSNNKVKYYGNVNSIQECQMACFKNLSCFAFTFYDSTSGPYSNMCYFRVDGLCPYTKESGCTSGRYIHIMAADLSNQNPNTFTSLFINGRRVVRARYPDGNPETMGLHTLPTGYVPSAERWLPPISHDAAQEIHISSPERNHTHFPEFQLGIGGPVSAFDPPESYWGTKHPTGGGGKTYAIPSGLQYSIDEDFVNRTWKRPEAGVVHVLHCEYWGNWIFAVDERDYDSRYIKWSYGGFQEARGCAFGQEWYIENIFEELDSPGEWYFDDVNKVLFLYPNGSLPSEGIGTVLDQLISIRGSLEEPVRNIALTNLTIAHSATTFLKSYEVPSGGDWSIHRAGAVFVEQVDGFLLQNCLFDSPGGNGVFLSNYIRNAVIEGNEFIYTGDSAIVAIGTADLMDGTNGNQPRGTKILGNFAHETGLYGKQTSPYGQALACQTEIIGNVFFNGPRAGINFNDGFGGGNVVKNNLLFNCVRETKDHGPFNTWDRQPYLTKVRNGSASLIPAQSNVTQNLIIDNYHSLHPIDHDDGSCYYYDTFNFLVYGGFKDYLGHTVTAQNNIYVYPEAQMGISSDDIINVRPFCAVVNGATRVTLPSGWDEAWINNTCITRSPNIYQFDKCDPKDLTDLVPYTANNSFYVLNEFLYISCGDLDFSLDEYQAMGYDKGSTVSDLPMIEQIIEWGRQILGL